MATKPNCVKCDHREGEHVEIVRAGRESLKPCINNEGLSICGCNDYVAPQESLQIDTAMLRGEVTRAIGHESWCERPGHDGTCEEAALWR